MDFAPGRMTHMPTYRMEPREHERFYPAKVRTIIENVIKAELDGHEFDQ